jgi:hypothetical protein
MAAWVFLMVHRFQQVLGEADEKFMAFVAGVRNRGGFPCVRQVGLPKGFHNPFEFR